MWQSSHSGRLSERKPVQNKALLRADAVWERDKPILSQRLTWKTLTFTPSCTVSAFLQLNAHRHTRKSPLATRTHDPCSRPPGRGFRFSPANAAAACLHLLSRSWKRWSGAQRLRKQKYRLHRPPTEWSSSREDPFIGLLRLVTFPDILLSYGCRNSSENSREKVQSQDFYIGKTLRGRGGLTEQSGWCLNLNIAVVIWD